MANDDRRARNTALPADIMKHIEGFLDVRGQAKYSMASKATHTAMHQLNPSLQLIRGAVRVGDVDLFKVRPGSPTFDPMTPRGEIATYPHLMQSNSGTHLTDINKNLLQVRHTMDPGTRTLGPAVPLAPKDGQLVPAVQRKDSFVRQKNSNKDKTGTLKPQFYEPQSPQTVLRASLPSDWQGKKVR